MKKILSILSACLIGAGSAHAAVVYETQQNIGDVLPSPIIAISGDLLEDSGVTLDGTESDGLVRNGTTGTAKENTAENPAKQWKVGGSETVTYNLDVSTNPFGYNIEEIRVFSGWDGGLADQKYDIYYSEVGSPDFTKLKGIDENRANSARSIMTRTYNDDPGITNMLVNVDAIRFTILSDGKVYREFDVIGTVADSLVPNDPPIADSQSVTGIVNTALNITLTGSDPNNDDLTYSIGDDPTNGVLSGTAPDLTYTPNTNYIGSDSFTFVANDGETNSEPALISITVLPNDPPTADSQSVTGFVNTAIDITLTGSDPNDGQTLTYIFEDPANGALSGTAPNLTYTPNTGYIGSDSFTFVANDGQTNSDPATVSITVEEDPRVVWVDHFGETGGSYASLNLSDIGTADWVKLGNGADFARDEMAGVDYIGAVASVGGSGDNSWLAASLGFNWTNGIAPNVTATDARGNFQTKSITDLTELGYGQTFSVDGLPAGDYLLKTYISKYKANTEMTASFGSTTTNITYVGTGLGGGSIGVINLRFSIAAGEALNVSCLVSERPGSVNDNTGILAIALEQTTVVPQTVGDISIDVVSTNQVALSWETSGGATYGVKASGNLSVGVWDNIISNVPGTGGEVTVTNTISAGAEFYRAYLQD